MALMTATTAFSCTTPTPHRAAFAVTGRLLSCIVTEGLLPALFLPLNCLGAAGVCIILAREKENTNCNVGGSSIYCVVPLRRIPVLKAAESPKGLLAVGLLDPMDMLPFVFDLPITLERLTDLEVRMKRALIPLGCLTSREIEHVGHGHLSLSQRY